MRRNMHISKTGLKLIKAYEGYRPVDRHLVNGQHVVGYGHIIQGDDSLVLSKPEAEDLLLRDLEPYEDMVNETVHAPLTQNQYDALVSLAFNIGPRAFTESDTLRALNNGRPLDAASGFDVWRKSIIDGKTYVVDALMRRRAAEKALFLRNENGKTLPASRADLPPVKDEMVALLSTEDALPVISNAPRNGLVARLPYEANQIRQMGDADAAAAASTPAALSIVQSQITRNAETSDFNRRRDDGPSGILELSEVYEGDEEQGRIAGIDDDLVDATYEVDDYGYEEGGVLAPLEPDESSSRIAKTASKISDRLDALIDNVASDNAGNDAQNWPESLIRAQTDDIETIDNNVVTDKKADIVIDSLVEDDAFRERSDSASKYINIEPSVPSETTEEKTGYWIPLLIGMSLIGASTGAIFGNPRVILGEWGPLISFVGLVIGIIMTFFTVYYVLKSKVSRRY